MATKYLICVQCSRKRGYGPGGLYCKQHAKTANPPCPHCGGTGIEPLDPREDPSDPGVTMSECSKCGGKGNA